MSALKLSQVSLYALPEIRRVSMYGLPDVKKQERILEFVCKELEVDQVMVKGKARDAEYVYARHLAMFIVRKKTKRSLVKIGEFMGKDHTSVIHGINSIKNYIATDEEKRDEIQRFLDNCLL